MNAVVGLDVLFIILERWHTLRQHREDVPFFDRVVEGQVYHARSVSDRLHFYAHTHGATYAFSVRQPWRGTS